MSRRDGNSNYSWYIRRAEERKKAQEQMKTFLRGCGITGTKCSFWAYNDATCEWDCLRTRGTGKHGCPEHTRMMEGE